MGVFKGIGRIKRSQIFLHKYINFSKKLLYIYRKKCAAIDNSSGMRLVPFPEKAQKILDELKERNGKVIELSKGAARNGFDQAQKSRT